MTDILTPAQEFESPADALAHYGVKGMKWGVRNSDAPKAKPSTSEIHNARAKVASKQRQINSQIDKTNLATGKKQEQEAKKLADMSTKFLNDPDRATALRLTKGEKVALTVLAVGVPGIGTTASAAVATSARVQRAGVERQQRKSS